MSGVIDIESKLPQINVFWSPKIIGDVNDYEVRVAKFKGDFDWHAHDDTDELFLVLEGRFRMDYRDTSHWVETGQMIIVPKGVEHKPFAEAECAVLMFEKTGTINTGDSESEK